MRILVVIQWRCHPTVRLDDALALVLLDEVLDSLHGHTLPGQHLDLEVGALVLQLLVRAHRDLHSTGNAKED